MFGIYTCGAGEIRVSSEGQARRDLRGKQAQPTPLPTSQVLEGNKWKRKKKKNQVQQTYEQSIRDSTSPSARTGTFVDIQMR
ncbi:hypothetical protein PTTG_25714 [Puccinia triticina 1-1 BBBD Race 1]|uniref:Uncharacterized protein n=1 Tax=Puccinia triticina (isolate 1-1 / race 1 (BBBD)) TaxID=630390 RepID=A0A180H0U6_PUCT1|nr:hypothetical protein PTTG_25714 [Puccinia triticina 1-1 BBBD Race 1]